MTKQDFELIAGVIREDLTTETTGFTSGVLAHVRQQVADAFADRLATQNPRFDRARFVRACGAE